MAVFKDSPSTLGPLLMSGFASAFFSGILTIQGAIYFRSFPNDNRWLKRLVGSTVLLSTLQAVLWIYLPWRWFVQRYGDRAELFTTSWTYGLDPIITQLTISLAQAFFIYRSYISAQQDLSVLLGLQYTRKSCIVRGLQCKTRRRSFRRAIQRIHINYRIMLHHRYGRCHYRRDYLETSYR